MTPWISLAGDPGTDARLDGRHARSTADFHALAKTALGFPEHYGRNWDAFEECLADVGGPLSVSHADVLLDAEPPRALAVFVDVVRTWAAERGAEVRLTAPREALEVAEARLRGAGVSESDLRARG